MKKIVHIIIGLKVGGAELMLKRLVLHSNEKNKFRHSVVSLTDLGVIGTELKQQGVDVYSLEMNTLSSLPLVFLKLRKLLKELNPDVVQTWMYHADFLGGLAAKTLGVNKIIWGIRNTELNTKEVLSRKAIVKLGAKLSYSVPNYIVCVASKAKQVHIEKGRYDSSKMLVIPNGFDMMKFQPDESQRNDLREKLNISTTELVIGNIGRFDPVKNHINFIQACIKLLQKGYKFKVLLAGRDVNLNNIHIAELFEYNSLRKNFIFLGEINDPPSFYNAIDIFCLCSTTEGFPNVLGEAMATGKICLATDAGDAWAILSNSGFRINSTSVDDIAAALEEKVLNDTLNSLKNMGLSARKTISDKYSISNIVSQFEVLY